MVSTYSEAGVDIDATEKATEALIAQIKNVGRKGDGEAIKLDKIKIIEALWSIIYSNKDADIYETNLMRRLAGLLYIDNKTMGDIKEKIKQNLE